MRLSTLFVLIPVAILATLFAVANRQEAIIRLDPFARPDAALAVAMPLYLLVFAALLAGVLLGGATVAMARNAAERKRVNTREIGDAIVNIEAEPADGPNPVAPPFRPDEIRP
jgi:uncharacterized integral membrane protein